MIVEKKSRIILALLIFCTNSVLAQIRGEGNITDTLISKKVTINLPIKYKKKVTRYDEGIFVDYLFQDGGSLTLFQGALQKIPLFSKEQGYYPLRIDTVKNRIIRSGVSDNKAWREDQLEDIRVCYDKVPFDKKNLYDCLLDNIWVSPYIVNK